MSKTVNVHGVQDSDNTIIGDGTTLFPLDSKGNFIIANGKRVALIGVNDLVVISQGDQIIVCKVDKSGEQRPSLPDQPPIHRIGDKPA